MALHHIFIIRAYLEVRPRANVATGEPSDECASINHILELAYNNQGSALGEMADNFEQRKAVERARAKTNAYFADRVAQGVQSGSSSAP